MQDSETVHNWGYTVKVASSHLPVASLAELEWRSGYTTWKGGEKWSSHAEKEDAAAAGSATTGAGAGVVYGASAETKGKHY